MFSELVTRLQPKLCSSTGSVSDVFAGWQPGKAAPKKGLWLKTSKLNVPGDYVVPTFVSSKWKWMEHAENPFFRFSLPSVRSQNFAKTVTQESQLQHVSYSNTLLVNLSSFGKNILATPFQLRWRCTTSFKFWFEQFKTWDHSLWHYVDECSCSGILEEIRVSMSNMYNYQFLCAQNLNFKSNQQQSICHEIIKAKTAHWTRFPPKTEKPLFKIL